MAEQAWAKLSAATFDDEKIELIEGMPEGDAIALIWIKLICLARKTNDGGLIYITAEVPFSEDTLSVKFHKPASLVRLALGTFQKLGMIEIYADGKIWLVNWAKYQFLEGLEKVREQARVRQERHRKSAQKRLRKIDIETNRNAVTHCNVTRNVTGHDDVTHCHDAESENIELEKEGEGAEAKSEAESPSPEPNRQTKKEFAPDVWLTQSEYETLVSDYSESETQTLIGELSNALGNTIPMNRYKSHYKALRNWIEKRRRDLAERGVKTPIALHVGEKIKKCPDCEKQYWGSACSCGWSEHMGREGTP
jgi:predicted phage replisome organizer